VRRPRKLPRGNGKEAEMTILPRPSRRIALAPLRMTPPGATSMATMIAAQR
jgi:hypothetical protein